MMKYLVFQYQDTTIEKAYLFSKQVKHADFAAMFPKEWKAVRGGFVQVMAVDEEVSINTYGEAFSLGLLADKNGKDAELIKFQFDEEY